MLTETRTLPDYDAPTAVTFLLAGIALGAVLTVLFSSLPDNSGVAQSSTTQPRTSASDVWR